MGSDSRPKGRCLSGSGEGQRTLLGRGGKGRETWVFTLLRQNRVVERETVGWRLGEGGASSSPRRRRGGSGRGREESAGGAPPLPAPLSDPPRGPKIGRGGYSWRPLRGPPPARSGKGQRAIARRRRSLADDDAPRVHAGSRRTERGSSHGALPSPLPRPSLPPPCNPSPQPSTCRARPAARSPTPCIHPPLVGKIERRGFQSPIAESATRPRPVSEGSSAPRALLEARLDAAEWSAGLDLVKNALDRKIVPPITAERARSKGGGSAIASADRASGPSGIWNGRPSRGQ